MRQLFHHKSVRLGILLFTLITLPFCSFSQSANNACGSSVLLTSNISCTTTTGNLQSATMDGPNSGCSHSTVNEVWFRFSAQATTTTITVNNLGSNLNLSTTYVEILSGTCGSFTSLSCQAVSSSLVRTSLTIGQVYYVRVYVTGSTSGNPTSKWNFDICVTHPAPPPANDNCASATSITSNSSCSNTAGTVVGGTSSGVVAPACGGTADDDVWYSFTAVQAVTTITLSSVGSSLSSSGTRMEIFSGTCGSLTSIDCSSGLTLTVSTLTPGSTYYIRVYSSGSTALTSNAGFNICVTHIAPPLNDGCLLATILLPGVTCTNTAGTVVGATNSGIAAPSCGGVPDDDVWYSFSSGLATNITITLSSLGSNLSASGAYLELFSGVCGTLTSIGCSNSGSISSGVTILTTYYVRVYSAGSSSITSNGTFNICVTTPVAAVPASVSTGKSFINISRPNGGTVIPGDVLEIRVSVNVSNNGTNRIFRARFNDTLPSNLNYVAGSLKLLTNEGKQYAAYTDAAGDDFAMYDAATRTVRFNLGRDTTGLPTSAVSTTGIDTTQGGGYYNSGTHRPRGNGMLVLVTYRVTVDASVAYNTTINYASGAIRYRNQLSGSGAVDYTLNPNSLSFMIYPDYGLCSNATGQNNITAGNGNFGSGITLNGSNPGTIPGYNFVTLAASNPGDGNYSIIKNLSPNQLIDFTVLRPNTVSGNRIFGVWDIIGDHTGASDVLAGNPPSVLGITGGYMLVVNAAYQLSVANNQTISGLCENTFYEFSAWFRNVCKRCGADSTGLGASGTSVSSSYIPTAPGDSSGVKPNLTFLIDGIDYYTTGNMDYIGTWGQWVKKGFVFKTGAGQTSVTISIKNNAPGGGGNDWAMDDIALATCLPALQMQPSNTPVYCQNNQIDMSVIVSTFYNNYIYYQWERSTDGGVTWTAAPELPGIQSYSYTYNGVNYVDTVALPSFIGTPAMNGYKYRIRTSTSLANLSTDACSVYNTADIITITVNTNCTPLPAEVLKFNSQLRDKHATINWSAKFEQNLQYYEVERSADAQNFLSIGKVVAKGTDATEVNYVFNDPVPVSGKVFYRLKLIGEDSAKKYSETVSVSLMQPKLFQLTNLVNPFDAKLSFQLYTFQNEQVEVYLLDASGRNVLNKKINVNQGTNALVIDAPSYLQRGAYFLRIVSANGTINKVIQKL